MNRLPDLLRMVLRDFCFVEWYEVSELAALVKTGQVKFDADLLERQLTEAIEIHEFPLGEVNELTGEEFKSSDDARSWMKEVRTQVFGLYYRK